ncbi:MAG: cobalamin-dependent protein [Thermoanaerobaculia bacterium]|nr:cobalamin-dependent protein [Thermoanaerobaculia bacterium]
MVADAFGVGVSSIKRWTDEGVLKAVKTAGGHRRYRIEDVYEFAWKNDYPTSELPPIPITEPDLEDSEARVDALLEALRTGRTSKADALVTWELAHSPDRTLVLDRFLGTVMRQIGALWEQGELTVDEEHRATNIVEEILARQSVIHVENPVGTALLACPPTEQHDLPLRFVKLVLEWNDWSVQYLGANVPWDSIVRSLPEVRPDLLLMSARSPEPFESPDFEELVAACEELGILLGAGGSWARGGPQADRGFRRFRTLKGLESFVRKLRS